jgi:hypothetical protein
LWPVRFLLEQPASLGNQHEEIWGLIGLWPVRFLLEQPASLSNQPSLPWQPA